MSRPPAARPHPAAAALRLRCPACGQGRLFTGWFTMHQRCPACGLDLRRAPGFYLGSIYVNYGVTALSTLLLFGLLVLGAGWSAERALAACLAVAVLLPLWLFRYARAILLAIDTAVNSEPATGEPGAGLTPAQLSAFRADDGQAGCFMGIAMTLVLLFGLAMAGVTLWFAVGAGSGDDPDAGSATTEPMEGPATPW